LRTLKEYAASLWPLVFVSLGGVATTLGGVLPRAQPWLGLGLAGLGVVGGVVFGVRKMRSSRQVRLASLRKAVLHVPPRPASQCDCFALGVAPSNVVSQRADGEQQPYISRDNDRALDHALAMHRFVVVRGASKAGKSRMAFEAVARCDDEPMLLVVRKNGSVSDVADNLNLLSPGQVIVWLDKLDGYIRPGRFDTAIQDQLLSRDGLRIVGTIENVAWNSIVNAEDHSHGAYEAASVLNSAHTVMIGPTSGAEYQRAKALYPGESFNLGIGAHFVAAQSLRDRYQAADPGLTAAVRAVVDWQRTGMTCPIPRDVLEQLHGEYLDGAEPEEDLLERGIEWANRADGAGVRLLDSRGRLSRSYSVPDHIVEWLTQFHPTQITQRTWELAIGEADADEALAVGSRALELHGRKQLEVAQVQSALWRALEQSEAQTRTRRLAASRLAMLMRRLGDDDDAALLFEDAIENGSLPAANNYGYMLMQQELYDKARDVLSDAMRRGNRTAAFNLLQTLAALDSLDEADAFFRPAAEDGNPAAALLLGNVHHVDDLDEADGLYAIAENCADEADASFRRRASMMRALVAEERGNHEEADKLFRASGNSDDWSLIVERLDHVGLTGRLSAVRDRIAARSG
jgi:uncharacterized protein